jgi:hypothetical protein
MEWSLKNKEFELTYVLYSQFYVGIPTSYLYKYMPQKDIFYSLSSFISNTGTITTHDNKFLEKLYELFKKSYLLQLDEFNNLYGYRLIKQNKLF